MHTLHDPVRLGLAEILAAEIDSALQIKLSPKDLSLDFASVPDRNMGHLAFPCFKLAKEARKSPKDIADQLAGSWSHDEAFSEVRGVGPYLNFFIEPGFFSETLVKPILEGDYFQFPQSQEKPFLIEYSQPNTHKELHVGHMRNLCFGHSLILLLQYCGNNVISCTFPGDVGTHVAKCLWFLKYHNSEPIPESDQGEWLGQLYTQAHNKLEAELGSDKEEMNRKQLTEILKQIERKEGEFFDLWQQTREWSIALMKRVYDWAGVTFDHWYWESDVDSESVKLVRKLYEQGKLIEDQGALGLNLEDEKLGFCMLLKSDGNGLYSTKDLELARRKFAEHDPQQNIVVVDLRQELHFKQVFASFEKLGLGEKDRCVHLKYNFVELPDGAMSSRKGNIIPITQLIENMKQTIADEYLSRYKGEWPEHEIDFVANQVAQGAIKYGMNRMDPNKKIVFDMKEWLRLDGESGPYIQYTHARLHSLISKLEGSVSAKPRAERLTHPREIELFIQLSQFNWSMYKSLEAYKTSGICNYLYDLAKVFNSFYHDCPIGKLDDEELKASRLLLVKAVKTALAQGLALLGIPAPNKM